MGLMEVQRKAFETNGYLVFESLFSQEEVNRLLRRLEELVAEGLERTDGIHMQVEPAVRRGESKAPSLLESLRKVERLVENDKFFRSLALDSRLLGIIQDIVGPDIKLFRDALMMKPAHHGSVKPYHQDSAYWRIEPPELVSAWVALDEATAENGCMRVIPGSHRWGVMEHKNIVDYQVDESKLDLSREVQVPLKPGGCLIFHSLLLHATSPNNSPKPRRAMIISCMSARSKWTGPPAEKPDFLLLQGSEHPGCV